MEPDLDRIGLRAEEMTAKDKTGRVSANARRQPPKAKKRRPRRPSLRNEEFLDKALDLFLEHGYERTSIEEITATAGMAKRTVYLRYGDKKALFKAALERAIEEWIVPVEKLKTVERDDLEESLLAIGQILVDNILSPAGLRLLRVTNAESGHMPEIGAYTVQRGTEPTIAYLANLFRRHIGRNGQGFSDAEDAAEAFINLVVGGPAIAAAWGVVRDKAAIDRRVRYSVRWFLHGLLPQSRATAAATSADDENARLKKLLAETMIQLDQALERLDESGTDGLAEQETTG
jgi:TetR/AcrR family transcriptional regulator, mexJK operon transcriptional repressor